MSPLAFAETLLSTTLPESSIAERARSIHDNLLSHSRYVVQPNFGSIHPDDLDLLFSAYDREFFAGGFTSALNGRRLRFRLSSRMTKAGGSTSVLRHLITGHVRYEITIASGMLFEGFSENDRAVTVCGLECPTRLHALQRIFEHELIHLAEQVCWTMTDCSAPRFRSIAARWFSHSESTHAMVTHRERAAEVGICVGSYVSFECDGRRLSGRVNRVTKRVSVLVPDPDGARYSDGSRYRTYYVPIGLLSLTAGNIG